MDEFYLTCNDNDKKGGPSDVGDMASNCVDILSVQHIGVNVYPHAKCHRMGTLILQDLTQSWPQKLTRDDSDEKILYR